MIKDAHNSTNQQIIQNNERRNSKDETFENFKELKKVAFIEDTW